MLRITKQFKGHTFSGINWWAFEVNEIALQKFITILFWYGTRIRKIM